jgi:integrase/recombinase XerD
MDNFANEFMTKLDGKLSPEQMKTVLMELEMFSAEYNIEKKSTEIVTYDNTIPECYKVYLVSKKIEGLSLETLRTYKCNLDEFFQCVNKPVQLITTNDIRIYLYAMSQKGNTNRTIDGKRLVVHTFFDWCVKEEYLDRNPAARINPIKFEVKPREPLSGIELELVRDACIDYRERALVELFYSTGCRVSEMVRLKKDDIDFQTKEVHLFGKGSKHRISYLNAKAEVYLKKYWLTRKDKCDNVIVTVRRPYRGATKGQIEQILHKLGERSGIGKNLYPHLIRHTTATDAIDRGMNVTEVQKILGHEKLDTTMIYAKVSQEAVKFNHHKFVV